MEPAVQRLVDRVQSRKPAVDIQAGAVLPPSMKPKTRIPGRPDDPRPKDPRPEVTRISGVPALRSLGEGGAR
jgi:hypothetical protein